MRNQFSLFPIHISSTVQYKFIFLASLSSTSLQQLSLLSLVQHPELEPYKRNRRRKKSHADKMFEQPRIINSLSWVLFFEPIHVSTSSPDTLLSLLHAPPLPCLPARITCTEHKLTRNRRPSHHPPNLTSPFNAHPPRASLARTLRVRRFQAPFP